jgi:hypothetical protein
MVVSHDSPAAEPCLMEPPAGLNEADFETIEAAVMETARGRCFLAEYSRRSRAQDTGRILSAIDRLDGAAFEAKAGEARANDNLERAAELVRLLVEVVHARHSAPPNPTQVAPPSPRTPVSLEEGPSATAAVRGSLDAGLEALANLPPQR